MTAENKTAPAKNGQDRARSKPVFRNAAEMVTEDLGAAVQAIGTALRFHAEQGGGDPRRAKRALDTAIERALQARGSLESTLEGMDPLQPGGTP